MKKLLIYTAIFSFFSFESFAISDEYFFQPALSIEYSAPSLSNSESKNFRSNNFGTQITSFQNIAIGGNVRVHRFLGFNANWVQGAMNGNSLQNVGYLNNKARYKFSQYNFSTLIYVPANNFVEFFAEAGISSIHGRLNYIENDGDVVNRKSNQTKALYGVGVQIKPYTNSEDAIRLSFQKYSGKLALLNANYSTVRIGYIKAF